MKSPIHTKKRKILYFLFTALFFCKNNMTAQLTLPMYSQRATLIQKIGISTVTIDYSRPRVTLNGEDRSGNIWGGLVPYGMTKSFMGGDMPWRAGADENTTFEFSHDTKIEGKELSAGKYGFHIIPKEDGTATLVFSENYHSWGSFMYDEKEDVLRVETKMEDAPHTEMLTIDMLIADREKAACALMWEKKKISFSIEFNTPEIVVENIGKELGQSASFVWQSFNMAADYCLKNEVELEQGLSWVNMGINYYGGNFTLYQTKAKILDKMEKVDEAKKARQISVAEADTYELHQYARGLTGEGKTDEAIYAYNRNFEKYMAKGVDIPWEKCAVHIGKARVYEMTGEKKKAKEYAKLALEYAGTDGQKKQVEKYIAQLEDN